MIGIIGSVLSLVASVVGDYYLAKWLGALKVWLDKKASQKLKDQIQAEYLKLSLQWEELRQKEKEYNADK